MLLDLGNLVLWISRSMRHLNLNLWLSLFDILHGNFTQSV